MGKYVPREEDLKRLQNNISYHPPFGDQVERYAANREVIMALGEHLLENCPPSRELSLALTHLEECLFWSNASIARNEKPPGNSG